MSYELPINHFLDKDLECPHCKSLLVERTGRFGKFLACPNFPKCKYACSATKGDRDRTYEDYLSNEYEERA